MGGGGGGGFSWEPNKVVEKVRQAEAETDNASFDTAVSELLGQLLSAYNDRDTGLVNERLDQIKECITDKVEGSANTLFGGSVAKKTYVDGFSDIDTLLILNNLDLPHNRPHELLEYFSKLLSKRLRADATVSAGQMAVTVDFADGMSIQVLPAIRTSSGVKVPDADKKNAWSEIDPQKFQAALTKRNQDCGGKLVPTIKLAKAINANLPKELQLSGYHIESLAIAAFKNYSGATVTSKMLAHFYETAKSLVLSPRRDSTGQSIHVDEYLGGENSSARQHASHILNRISKRIRNANAAQSQDQWLDLFGHE